LRRQRPADGAFYLLATVMNQALTLAFRQVAKNSLTIPDIPGFGDFLATFSPVRWGLWRVMAGRCGSLDKTQAIDIYG
jgi:hypothetical protein